MKEMVIHDQLMKIWIKKFKAYWRY